jgi:hypothetical protein
MFVPDSDALADAPTDAVPDAARQHAAERDVFPLRP